ncbi:transmembrane and TPR repeat-containing protein 1-like [Lingula anatina]|uniref:Transmembrane and TPR repeat-containing protein 1-like n=1 Tax=Lingula anatina TaxID=7574 RepID=A0A1S3H6R6_LINAN|nr:transmembrane and TPR repeat-containing protein 1-like [Lingula anatina]|eukprot:XP_013381672.1 transmembrane and TPR repeat-containing protein 1-like [Lingula anatina]
MAQSTWNKFWFRVDTYVKYFPFSRALSIKRDSINLDTLAVFYFNQGRTTEALKIFSELERSFPNDLDAMCHYAQALTRLEQYSKAEALLLKILHTDGGHVEALRQLATLCGILGRHQEALQHISKALSPGAQTVDKLTRAAIYYEEGNHWKDLKQYQQAAKSYKAAVSLDPSLPQAWLNLGAIYHLLDEFDSAKFHYHQALKLNPNNEILKENIKKLERRQQQLINNKKNKTS